MAWAHRPDTCPWLYSGVSLPCHPFRAGLRTVHTQSLHFNGPLEPPSDISMLPLVYSPGERWQAKALDPHHVGISNPALCRNWDATQMSSQAPGRPDAQPLRDCAQYVAFLTSCSLPSSTPFDPILCVTDIVLPVKYCIQNQKPCYKRQSWALGRNSVICIACECWEIFKVCFPSVFCFECILSSAAFMPISHPHTKFFSNPLWVSEFPNRSKIL